MNPNVPNLFPSRAAHPRIALIGEAASSSDRSWVRCTSCKHAFSSVTAQQTFESCMRCGSPVEAAPRPFTGPAGGLLALLLNRIGLRLEECFLGNVCQVVPPRGEIKRFKWAGAEIQEGLKQLQLDLQAFQPDFVIGFGWGALKALRGGLASSLDDWRGYIFDSALSLGPVVPPLGPDRLVVGALSGDTEVKEPVRPGVKCLATFHPALLLKSPSGPETAIAEFDLRKALKAARNPSPVPVRTLHVSDSHTELLLRLSLIKEKRTPCSIDIEGSCHAISCIGFSTSPTEAFVVPFITVEGESVWTMEEEQQLWSAIASILEDASIPKCIMNALYEWFALAWCLGIVIEGVQDDIMLKHFELYCEFEKSLEFQAVLYTQQPHWKLSHRKDRSTGLYRPFRDGKPVSSEEWYRYNGTDCCVTEECNRAQERLLQPKQRSHYNENMQALAPILYMMLRGMRYNYEKAKAHRKEVEHKIYALQDRINRECAEARPALAAFFGGVASSKRDGRNGNTVAEGQLREGLVGGGTALLSLLADAFCQARRTLKQQVEEVSWQPMRWNGKKWVKGGKRVSAVPDDVWIEFSPTIEGDVGSKAWQRISKLVERSVTQPITSLTDIQHWCLASKRRECRRALAIVRVAMRRGWTPALCGELATLLGVSLKIRASGRDKDEFDESGELQRGDERDANWFLYEHCKLPKQYVKEGNALTDRLASDEEAVIKAWLATHKDKRKRDRRALWFATLKKLLTEARNLTARGDDDGRIRSSYNIVGAETHRLSNSRSPTGTSRLNLQTITKKHRKFYEADDGCEMCQRDLSGADGWTVAAYCAMLGDRNLLEDYKAKLKPAQVMTLMEMGHSVNQMTRPALAPLCSPITEETHWQYFANKRKQHGWCVTAGHELLTPTGWVPIETLGLGQQIACYDLRTRKVYFERPSAMTAFDYSGNLYSFEGHSLSLEVTADHRMPYTTNGNPKVITAAEMFMRKAAHLPTAGIGFDIGGAYTRLFGALIAAIHSDGHYTKKGYLTFHFKKKRKIERLTMLLTLLGMPFKEYTCKDSTHFSITDKRALASLRPWGKAASSDMLAWSVQAIQGYLNDYPLWDGYRKGDVQTIFAKDKAHLDWIDTFAHLSLMNGCYQGEYTSGFGSQIHRMSLNNRSFADLAAIDKSVREVENVPVFCPTVSTGFVLVRRNGKISVTGNSYKMGDKTTSDQILTDSIKKGSMPIYIEPSTCKRQRDTIFFVRYPGIPRWHRWMEETLRTEGALASDDGFIRRFYGRKDAQETLRKALAHLPQYYTTRATLNALMRLWRDPSNRREDGSLRVEPLHTVHDSLVVQWRKEDREWARGKMKEWFENPMQIAGMTLTIPASGSYGCSWGEQDEKL